MARESFREAALAGARVLLPPSHEMAAAEAGAALHAGRGTPGGWAVGGERRGRRSPDPPPTVQLGPLARWLLSGEL